MAANRLESAPLSLPICGGFEASEASEAPEAFEAFEAAANTLEPGGGALLYVATASSSSSRLFVVFVDVVLAQ